MKSLRVTRRRAKLPMRLPALLPRMLQARPPRTTHPSQRPLLQHHQQIIPRRILTPSSSVTCPSSPLLRATARTQPILQPPPTGHLRATRRFLLLSRPPTPQSLLILPHRLLSLRLPRTPLRLRLLKPHRLSLQPLSLMARPVLPVELRRLAPQGAEAALHRTSMLVGSTA